MKFQVLAQLKFRYDREIDKVQRSVIRKMVEQDDTAAKRMILFVSRILGNSSVCSLELSDGWYSIRTSGLDSVLTHAVSTGKISIGTKLVIQGAEIVGFEEACSPLEVRKFALKLFNSTTIVNFNELFFLFYIDAKFSCIQNISQFN